MGAFSFPRMAAERFEVLKKNVDLRGKEIKVMARYREDPQPADPARLDRELATETLSIQDLVTVLYERWLCQFCFTSIHKT